MITPTVIKEKHPGTYRFNWLVGVATYLAKFSLSFLLKVLYARRNPLSPPLKNPVLTVSYSPQMDCAVVTLADMSPFLATMSPQTQPTPETLQ